MNRHNLYRVSSPRSEAVVNPMHQRIESVDGARWALGRNVKRALADHRWDAVEVWTLKQRDANGRAVTVRKHCSRAEAEAWVTSAPPPQP